MAADRKTTSRPRLLVLNQYYWPGVEATAQPLHRALRSARRGLRDHVVTGRLRGRPELPATGGAQRRGDPARAIDVATTASQLSRRALNYVTYLCSRCARALAAPRPDIVLCWTDPPSSATWRYSSRGGYRAPLVVISEDVFPEIAVALRSTEEPRGRRSSSGSVVRTYLRRADRVVAIGDTMGQRLEAKGVSSRSGSG